MSEADKDLPEDEELRTVLRQWDVEGAPARLDESVLAAYRGARRSPRRWRRLLVARVPVSLPVAVGLGGLLLLAGYAAGRSSPDPRPAAAPTESAATAQAQVVGFPLVTTTPLTGFQPLPEVTVRVLGKEEPHGK